MTPFSNAWKGLTLALANTVVIAVCLAITEHDAQMTPMVVSIAAIPASITGLVAGALVGAIPKHLVWWRLLALLVLAIGLVAVLGTLFGMPQYILVASIPTLVACAVLEKWTRWTNPDEVPCRARAMFAARNDRSSRD